MPEWASLDAFGRELAGFELDLTGPEKKVITRAMGAEAQTIAASTAARSLGGDRAFSGWRRGAPIPLDTRLVPARDFNTLLVPTRSSAGPWTVAEFGRNSRLGPRIVGPRLTKKGRVSRARVRRYNGTTRGKGTASRAEATMEQRIPKIVDRKVLQIARKRFTVT